MDHILHPWCSCNLFLLEMCNASRNQYEGMSCPKRHSAIPACSSIPLADLLPRVFLLFHFFFFSPISLSSPFYSSPLSCIENAKLLASRTSADRDFQFCHHRMVVTVWETLTFVFNLTLTSSMSCPLVKKTTNSWSQLNLSFHLWCCRPLSCPLGPTSCFFSRFNHFSWRSYSTIR